eukprot:4808240-Prymnesium_polylepis.1
MQPAITCDEPNAVRFRLGGAFGSRRPHALEPLAAAIGLALSTKARERACTLTPVGSLTAAAPSSMLRISRASPL